ncbi:MAG: biopolymer transporter ExbD [Cellvibrionaceae bacterium]
MLQSTFQYQRPRYATKLNLVALMDIFTILVFFLLLNSGEAEKLENAKFIQLPNSSAGDPPHDDLVVMIGGDAIWLGDQLLVTLDEVANSSEPAIQSLADALADYRERKGELNSYEEQNGLALTIMGDQAVPFGLLKAVMATCRLENFRDIALAVNQVAPPTLGPANTPSLALSGTASGN